MATEALTPVFDYTDQRLEHAMESGQVNTTDDAILLNIRASIRRGHPQVQPGPLRRDRVCLVGSGPSLNNTVDELLQLYFEGAFVVTVNGAYHWCLDRNIRPSAQIILDARASNSRFLQPAVPRCQYLIASQCAPECWDVVEGRPGVWIFHAHATKDDEIGKLLTSFYVGAGNWLGVGGGVTVITRALMLYRLLGYLRFDLFGVDCCWMGDKHHAMEQPENARDQLIEVSVASSDGSCERKFRCSPWHLKQAEDLAHMIRIMPNSWLLNVHGDGMLRHMLEVHGSPVR